MYVQESPTTGARRNTRQNNNLWTVLLVGGCFLLAALIALFLLWWFAFPHSLRAESKLTPYDYNDSNYGAAPTYGASSTPAALFTSTPTPTMTPTEVPNVLTQDAKYGWGYTHDITCVRNTFEKLGVTRMVNVGQAVGNDGSPSATLGLIGVISDGTAASEFDNTNGRSVTVRGGETGQISTSEPLHIVFVFLSQNDLTFANYYSNPQQNLVVTPTGEALGSVGFEINEGKGTLNANLLYNQQVVGFVNGPIHIVADIGSVYNTSDSTYQMGGTFGAYSADNLRGIGVPTNYLPGGCWAIEMSISVPQQAVMTIGLGSFQQRYTAVADYGISS